MPDYDNIATTLVSLAMLYEPNETMDASRAMAAVEKATADQDALHDAGALQQHYSSTAISMCPWVESVP